MTGESAREKSMERGVAKTHQIIETSFRPTPAQAGGEPESMNFEGAWMPAFAGMTVVR